MSNNRIHRNAERDHAITSALFSAVTPDGLTQKQLQSLVFTAMGYTRDEVARIVGCSESTVSHAAATHKDTIREIEANKNLLVTETLEHTAYGTAWLLAENTKRIMESFSASKTPLSLADHQKLAQTLSNLARAMQTMRDTSPNTPATPAGRAAKHRKVLQSVLPYPPQVVDTPVSDPDKSQ